MASPENRSHFVRVVWEEGRVHPFQKTVACHWIGEHRGWHSQ
jgi:hypothetical protein